MGFIYIYYGLTMICVMAAQALEREYGKNSVRCVDWPVMYERQLVVGWQCFQRHYSRGQESEIGNIAVVELDLTVLFILVGVVIRAFDGGKSIIPGARWC